MKKEDIMAMSKVQLETEIEKLRYELERSKREIKYYRDMTSSQAQKIEDIYAEKNVIGKDVYEKLKADCDYYCQQLEISNKTHNRILKQEHQRHDDLIKSFEEQTVELQAFRNSEKAIKPHNERGAGRKTKISDREILMAKNYRNSGNTYLEIASLLGLAVGTVYKILNPDKVKKTL